MADHNSGRKMGVKHRLRKNWGLIASLIGTCKLNGVNPFDYLKATLEALANGYPQSRLDDLMPWVFNKKSS